MNPELMPLLKTAYAKAADAKDTAESQEAAALLDKAMGIVDREESRERLGPCFETLDAEAEFRLGQLRKLARELQEFGQSITQHDYSDGVNVGQAILAFVGECGKLANKFEEIGLYDDKESFFL